MKLTQITHKVQRNVLIFKFDTIGNVVSLLTYCFSRSVTVSVGVSKLGFTNLICVDPGVKVNGSYYWDVLL